MIGNDPAVVIIHYSEYQLKKTFLNVSLLFEREREHEQRRGGEGETESEAGSRLCAVSTEPDAGLKPTDREIMT